MGSRWWNDSLATADRTGEHWRSADLHRLRGELLLAHRAAEREAEAAFTRARTIAGRQEARLLGLRATVSLARLRRRRSHGDEASRILRDACLWFTEDDGSPEVRRAEELLAELS
jgi:hypothetical protein